MGGSRGADRETVLKAQLAWERGDGTLLAEVMHPEIEWVDESRVESATSVGLEGLREAYRVWVGTWSTYESGHEEIVDLGGGRFYTPQWERGRGKGSGVETERTFATVFEVSDGRIVRMHSFGDRAAARAAAGLQPEAG